MNFALGIIMIITTFTTALPAQGVVVEPLAAAPQTIEKYAEIATQYNCALPDLWNNLKPQERVFTYYMMRASLPGSPIYADQLHRDAPKMIELFERIITQKDALSRQCSKQFDVSAFIAQAELFLVYLFAHHGQYFAKEFQDHKRTPERLNLTLLTPENIILALQATGLKNAVQEINQLKDSLFNAQSEPTLSVEGSIEKSGVNFYSPDFTEADFATFDLAERSTINAYFYIDSVGGKRVAKMMKYKIGGKYSEELRVAHYWLSKAHDYALQYPDIFDAHITASLKLLMRYLIGGDEEDFRQFSIQWLRTKSRIDFNFGFVEVYQDPKQYRGSFEADVTIKTTDMKKLNAILPTLEKKLPFPAAFMRDNLDDVNAIPNASVNAKVFASGEAGPVKTTAAYCLPNYTDIRAQYGSKQIIYQMGKGLAELINPVLSRRLFHSKKHADWLDKNDPQGTLEHDLWDVQVLLHETLGHGSGKLATHTFTDSELLTIDGKTYQVGNTIEVTEKNNNELIGNYSSGLEELRAEIIALYTSIFNLNELDTNGLYKDWVQKIGKEELIEWLIIHMAQHGLNRLITQKEDAQEIVQAHAQANNAILNYLLDHGGLQLVEEEYSVDGKKHTVIDVEVTDLNQAVQAIKEFAIQVQTIKSTANGTALAHLMKTYGTCIRHPQYIKIFKENRQAIVGQLKEVAEIYPRLIPVVDEKGNVADISAQWPTTFLEQQLELSKLAMMTEF